MGRLLNESDVYALFDQRGMARLHVGDIDVLPRVEVKEVAHGRWEWRGGIPWCGNCGEMLPGYSYDGDITPTKHCPNCGAKMGKEEDNDLSL